MKKITLGSIFGLILLTIGFGCIKTNQTIPPVGPAPHQEQTSAPFTPPNESANDAVTPTTTSIPYIVPADVSGYFNKMGEYVSAGSPVTEPNPAKTMEFVTKTGITPFTTTPMRESIEAALQELPAGGGPAHATTYYFKLVSNTAYILLDIDGPNGGWAGVSIVQGILHPIVEKNLLLYPDIKKVVFGKALGDK